MSAGILRGKNVIWEPHPGSQQFFLTCPADEALIHGNRGGGKTDVLLMDYLQHVGQGYGEAWRGILFREEYTELTDIIAKSQKWIRRIFPGAKYNGTDHKWTFPEGETLLLRYMRLPSDYWNYHGHEYTIAANTLVLLPDNKTTQIKNIKVGDFVQTLAGPKRVSKVFHYNKPAIKLSVYDSDSCLIGEQLQGVMHPVLTTDGWQRPGLSCLSQISQQSLSESPLVTEVQRFLFGVHQEILQSSLMMFSDPLGFSSEALHQVQFSVLHQILQQLPLTTSLKSLAVRFLHGIDLGILLASSWEQISVETFGEQFLYSLPTVQRLALQCVFLIVLLLRIRVFQTHLIQSTLFRIYGRSFLLKRQIFQGHQQLDHENIFVQKQLYGQLLPVLGQNALNDIYSCVLLEKNKGEGYQGGYFSDHSLYDELLRLEPVSGPTRVPLLSGASDAPCASRNFDPAEGFYFQNPYESENRSRAVMPFGNLIGTVHVSSLDTSIDMVDLEVESEHHYLTSLSTHDTPNLNKSQYINDTASKHINSTYIVNQNCFIGFEELTNWSTDECYKLMMSCNRSSHKGIPKKVRATCNPSGPGHCVPFGEVLTPRGWVDIKDIKVSDVVFTVDSNGYLLEAPVDQIHKSHYDGDLCEMDIRGSYLCCTPEHKMPKVGGVVGNRGQAFTLLPVSELPGQAEILRTVNWEGTKLPETISVPRRVVPGRRKSRNPDQPDSIPYDLYLRLLGWFLSEGGTLDRDEMFYISKSKASYPEQYAEIDQLLTDCGFYRKSNSLNVYASNWWQHFKQFGSYTDKFIPVEVKNSTKEELRVVLETMMRGDGSWKGCNKPQTSGTYWTTSPQLASDFAEIALKLGYRVNTKQGKRDHQRHLVYWVNIRETKSTILYTGNHRYGVSTTSGTKNVNKIPYKGDVYCIGLDNTHTFILRQNGSVWISGNSWVKMYYIDVAPALTIHTDEETKRTRVHIPSRLHENKALLEADPNYASTIIAAAKDDPAKTKAWVLGDWDIIAGGAFTNVWEPKKQVLNPFPFPKSWNVFRSFDWGSAKPWCVTYGAECNGEQPDPDYVEQYKLPYFPKDSVIIIDEIYGWDGTPDHGDFATSDMIAEQVLTKDAAIIKEFGCKVIPGPADTNIYEVRDGTSIAKTMSGLGLHWKRAYKGSGSRVAGLSLLRQMLSASKNRSIELPSLYFFTRARHHIRTFPLLQYDERNMEDIDTSNEDHCLVGDTLVHTKTGIKKIKDLVGTTGEVLSVGGKYVRYYNCKKYFDDAAIVRVSFSDGSYVDCTPDHEFLTDSGLVEAIKLDSNSNVRVVLWNQLESYQKNNKSFVGKFITNAVSTFKRKVLGYTGRCGNTTTVRYLKGLLSTILMRTNLIIKLITLNCWKIQNTFPYIPQGTTVGCQKSVLQKQQNGIKEIKVRNGISSITKIIKKRFMLKYQESVLPVAVRLKHILDIKNVCSVPTIVKQHTVENLELTKLSGNVRCVQKNSAHIKTLQGEHVEEDAIESVTVSSIKELPYKEPVYCLTAEDTHVFVVNSGILVSNCYDSTRYLMTRKYTKLKRRKVGY
jgi:hypothetical protein